MDLRIQQALDQELPRSELSEAELAELAEAEVAISGVLRAISATALPPLAHDVLRRIRQTEQPAAGARRSVLAWLWKPRPLVWRPVYALPVAAAIAVLLILTHSESQPTPSAPAHVLVEFRLHAPQATRVSLAGEFTNWQPSYALARGEPGVWTVVVPLAPGVHDYAFIIDGEHWIPDPMAPAVADGFGGYNSRLAVLPPDPES